MSTSIRTVLLVGLSAALSCITPPDFDYVLHTDPLENRAVLSYELESDGVVSYEYAGDSLPELLAPDEVRERRTNSSYTQYVDTEPDGAATYTLIAFTREVYVQTEEGWRIRAHATTSAHTFALHGDPTFFQRALAASYSGFSTSADGQYQFIVNPADTPVSGLADCTSASHPEGSTLSNTSATTAEVYSRYRTISIGQCSVIRAYFPFDTSTIPSGSTVSAATLSVYVTAKVNGVNDGSDTINLVQGAASFTGFGSTDGAASIDIGVISTSAYNNYTLDATGRSWITTGGTTALGLRTGNDLVTDIADNISGNGVTISMSEEAGTSQDPSLSVTYTEPAPAPARPVRISEGFQVRILEGRVIIY